MTCGERIKKRRKEIGISAEELAYRVGKSRATVYRYENGEIEDMPITVLEPLADALLTTPAYLMGWADDPRDWEQIGNDAGVYPPKDYSGSYEEYVKFKMLHESDDAASHFQNAYEYDSREHTPHHENSIEDILEILHKRPEMKALFSVTKNASKEDVEKAVKIIEALKGE